MRLWNTLKEARVPFKLLRAIQITYKDFLFIGSRLLVVENTLTYTGVRQGSVLSPLLFIVFIDRVMKEIEQREMSVECFAYADDVGQTACSRGELSDIMNHWDDALCRSGLKRNYEKTEYMMIGRRVEEEGIVINDRNIRRVDEFKYLGSVISSDRRMEPEINSRVTKYSRSVGILYALLRENDIPT